MKKMDWSKAIGLVSDMRGGYEPSNQRSKEKLDKMFRESSGGFFANGPDKIGPGMLPELRKLAKEAGYKIFTSLRVIRS